MVTAKPALQPEPPKPTERNLAQELAHAIRALQSEEKLFSEVKAEFKGRIERLQNEVDRITDDVLTGQGQLPLEETP